MDHLVSSGTSSRIDVVFASDEAFVPYLASALFSLLNSYSDNRELVVHILTGGLEDASVSALRALRKVRNFDLRVVEMNAGDFFGVKTTPGISEVTYYRLLMAEQLIDADRCLYLDCDIVIKDNIASIYDIPLDGLLFRGVEDSLSKKYRRDFNLPEDAKHVNAGVLLCNLSEMRSQAIPSQVNAFVTANRERIVLGDQQIINELFYAQLDYLPVRWNVHGSMFSDEWAHKNAGENNGLTYSEIRASANRPAIIHYTYKRKPWISSEHPRANDWHVAYRKTYKLIKHAKPGFPLPSRVEWMQRMASVLSPITKATKRTYKFFSKRFKKKQKKGEVNLTEPVLDLLFFYAAEKISMRNTGVFSAEDIIRNLPSNLAIMSNITQRDLSTNNSNLKLLFKTNNITMTNSTCCSLAVIGLQRPRLTEYWRTINCAVLHDIPLYFVEAGFFAGYASYFDTAASDREKQTLGYFLDDCAFYFDSRVPSRLEKTLNDPSFAITPSQRQMCTSIIKRIREKRYTKYNKYISEKPVRFSEKFVLVIDQKRGDASINNAKADSRTFVRMLHDAIMENPSCKIYLKIHPDNITQGRGSPDFDGISHPRLKVIHDNISLDLLDFAEKIYVVSSQMGFEALLRNKEVVTYGQPFYAGWGLTLDRNPISRRTAKRTIEELFHVACIKQTVYINPSTGELTSMNSMFDCIDKFRAQQAG